MKNNPLFAAAGCFLLALAALQACGGDGDKSTPTPVPSTPQPTATPTNRPPVPTSDPPVTAYRLVYREFGATEDVIWHTDPLNPADRQELARIPHREGYGIKPALSPDGKMLAYLIQPEHAQSAESSQAEAWVIELGADPREPGKVAEGVDLTFAPLWSPDSRLLYLRRYAGPEFLSATVSIIRTYVTRKDDPTPTPSPSPPPDGTPIPTTDPISVALSDSVAHVLSFTPIGFADDKESMFFIQVEGGTNSGTLVGIYSPATTEAVKKVQDAIAAAIKATEDENRRLAEEAAAAGNPPPEVTLTPPPTPAPVSKFVVQLSEQLTADNRLSPDAHKVSYLNQEFDDAGDILNHAYVADLILATTAPMPTPGLASGQHLEPVWHPDGRLTLGLLPSAGGTGLLTVISLDGSSVTFLAQPDAGFDEPRSWAPDGSWLAVAHHAGSSIANPGAGRLDVVASTGQRNTIIEGADNITEDSVLGWLPVTPPQ